AGVGAVAAQLRHFAAGPRRRAMPRGAFIVALALRAVGLRALARLVAGAELSAGAGVRAVAADGAAARRRGAVGAILRHALLIVVAAGAVAFRRLARRARRVAIADAVVEPRCAGAAVGQAAHMVDGIALEVRALLIGHARFALHMQVVALHLRVADVGAA